MLNLGRGRAQRPNELARVPHGFTVVDAVPCGPSVRGQLKSLDQRFDGREFGLRQPASPAFATPAAG